MLANFLLYNKYWKQPYYLNGYYFQLPLREWYRYQYQFQLSAAEDFAVVFFRPVISFES